MSLRLSAGRGRRTVAWVGSLVCAVLTLASCTDAAPTPSSGDGQGFVSGGGTASVIEPADRVVAPEVAGQTLQEEELSLADFEGDVVVVNVWGSWCAPCREEAPSLQEVSQETRDDGVQFVGLNTRDAAAQALAFERRFGITYPSLVDADGQLQLEFRDSLPPTAIPSTLIIDRQGRVAARILGATSYTQLSDLVADIAAEDQ